jgi:hypothetical protein
MRRRRILIRKSPWFDFFTASQRDDPVDAVHVGDRGPAEFVRSGTTLPQGRVDQPERRGASRQNGFRFGQRRHTFPLAHARLFQLPEHGLVEQVVFQGEFLQTSQGHDIVVPRAVNVDEIEEAVREHPGGDSGMQAQEREPAPQVPQPVRTVHEMVEWRRPFAHSRHGRVPGGARRSVRTPVGLPALCPGAHVFIATNAFISQLLYSALVVSGLEFRGEIIRLVRTLRGGDRPKNAETEFPDVSSMAKGCYEPWGIFRKPLPAEMTVSDCLRNFGTGGIRRTAEGMPLDDVIPSGRTAAREKEIADHPSLKPQAFLRRVVYSSLPLGNGVVLDPFMGSGSTIAAAEAVG